MPFAGGPAHAKRCSLPRETETAVARIEIALLPRIIARAYRGHFRPRRDRHNRGAGNAAYWSHVRGGYREISGPWLICARLRPSSWGGKIRDISESTSPGTPASERQLRHGCAAL